MISSGVNPGQVMKLLFFTAFGEEEMTGEKHAACKKYARLLCVCFLRMMMFAYLLRVDKLRPTR